MMAQKRIKTNGVKDMLLHEKSCIPCKGNLPKMSYEQAELLLKDLDGWSLIENGCWLTKTITCKDFKSALSIVNNIGEIAEKEQHHPDIELTWGCVIIRIQTHAIGGLHENDFILAAKIDGLS